MKIFWVSWWTTFELGSFELHNPWWFSGHRIGSFNASSNELSVCAAVKAESEEAVKEKILSSYDKRPDPMSVEWRFVVEKPTDWSPFCNRFPRRDWMKWEEEFQEA